jgi:hypothetical protein
MPRDIDVVGVWHGTPYQVASVNSTANVVIVACGTAGRHTTYPRSGHRHTKDPSSGKSTWYERQVPLSDAPPAVVQSTHRRSGYGEHATRLARRVIGRESGLMARELS